jgi:hypothetical protein
MKRAISPPPNNAVERTTGSRALAAAAHRERYADNASVSRVHE